MNTRIAYFKNGIEVPRPRSIIIGNSTYVPPTDKLLLEVGYEIREIEIKKYTPHILTYEEKVVELIRLKYTTDLELAILRQRDTKPLEFEMYNSYCEECKQKAKE